MNYKNGELNMKIKLFTLSLLTVGTIMAGCTANRNTLPNNSTTQETAVSSSSTASSSKQNGATTPEIKLSLEEAVTAYEKAYPNTAITSIDLDNSFGGVYYYAIKGVDDSKEYELKINTETGEEHKEREETLDTDEQNGVKKAEEALDLKDIISFNEATKLATESLEKSAGSATDWSLEREMSITYWEVNFESDTSVKLNAKTGEILEIELED